MKRKSRRFTRRMVMPQQLSRLGQFRYCMTCLLILVIMCVFVALYNHNRSVTPTYGSNVSLQSLRQKHTSDSTDDYSIIGPCAINLYGLPRKFKDMVLPGLIKNVILVNAKYNCDYFVHYYDRTEELDYRGADIGRGGTINPQEVKLLSHEVERAYLDISSNDGNNKNVDQRPPRVAYVKDSEDSFFERYNPLLTRIFTERADGPQGSLLYMPLSEKEPFPNATIVNIIKMWHSQQSVWNLMEPSLSLPAADAGHSDQKHYSRVAMLRNDILYVTTIDIYELPDGSMDYQNQYAVIPNFGNFPVNDRMIYGPYDAVQIWAAGRFRRLSEHIQRIASTGDGIHPEKYLYHTLFPAIRDAGIPILPAGPNLCFLRVRSDSSVRLGDCGLGCVTVQNQKAIESLLRRSCRLNRSNPDVAFLECDTSSTLQKPPTTIAAALPWEPCPWKERTAFSAFRFLQQYFS